jgi:hypothetical protein
MASDGLQEPNLASQPLYGRWSSFWYTRTGRRKKREPDIFGRKEDNNFPPQRPGFEARSSHVEIVNIAALGQVSSKYFVFPLQLIPRTAPSSSPSIIRGWYNRTNSGGSTKWRLSLTLPQETNRKVKNTNAIARIISTAVQFITSVLLTFKSSTVRLAYCPNKMANIGADMGVQFPPPWPQLFRCTIILCVTYLIYAANLQKPFF